MTFANFSWAAEIWPTILCKEYFLKNAHKTNIFSMLKSLGLRLVSTINCKEYEKDSPTQFETLNTEKSPTKLKSKIRKEKQKQKKKKSKNEALQNKC